MTTQVNPKTAARKVIISTYAEQSPLSYSQSVPNTYYCLAYDLSGFQYTIDLQARPPGVEIWTITPNQVWWVEKGTSQYRLTLFAGYFDPNTNTIDSAPTVGVTSNNPVDPTLFMPVGTLLDYAGPTAPSGYLLCDGSSYSTTTYPNLFNAIGYNWGGSGGTFNVPDFRGRTAVGAGQGTGLTNRALATVSGEEKHTLTSAETGVASHTHSVTDNAHSHSITTSTSTSISDGGHSHSVNDPKHTHALSDPGHAHLSPGATSTSFIVQDTANGNYSLAAKGATSTVVGYNEGVSVQSSFTSVSVSGTSSTGVSVTSATTNITANSSSSSSSNSVATTGTAAAPATANASSAHNNMQPFAVVTKIIKY